MNAHPAGSRQIYWPSVITVISAAILIGAEVFGAAIRAGHLPAQDTALAACAVLGAIHESLVGPLAPDNLDVPVKLRDAVQTVTLLALRAVGVMDARARGLVVQAALPAKMLAGA